jgi:hypothetical protein
MGLAAGRIQVQVRILRTFFSWERQDRLFNSGQTFFQHPNFIFGIRFLLPFEIDDFRFSVLHETPCIMMIPERWIISMEVDPAVQYFVGRVEWARRQFFDTLALFTSL